MKDVRRTSPRLKPGLKRAQILQVAAEQFGRHGYEETKWADVAESVGIGSTALYHYFESKQHCLFEIMAKAVVEFREQFDRRVAKHDDWGEALVAVLRGGFELSEWEVLRLRVLTAEHARVDVQRIAPARGGGPRERTRATSATWSSRGGRSSPAGWSRGWCRSGRRSC